MVASAYRKTSRTLYNYTPVIIWSILAGLFIWGLVVFIQWNIAWHRGLWSGMHESSALSHAQQVMIVNNGAREAAKMHFASPAAVKETSTGLLNVGQVWVVRVIGNHGRHYCVTVWHPTNNFLHHVNVGSYYFLKKDCNFHASH